jgi:hypothetical protein
MVLSRETAECEQIAQAAIEENHKCGTVSPGLPRFDEVSRHCEAAKPAERLGAVTEVATIRRSIAQE